MEAPEGKPLLRVSWTPGPQEIPRPCGTLAPAPPPAGLPGAEAG